MPTQASTATTVTLGTGDVQVTLTWDSPNDLDLWVIDPGGEKIMYNHRISVSGGELDVDANAACANLTAAPVENIFWPPGGAPLGAYEVVVHSYKVCSDSAVDDFHVRLLVDGVETEFEGQLTTQKQRTTVTTFAR